MPPRTKKPVHRSVEQITMETMQKEEMRVRLVISIFREGIISKAEARKHLGLPVVPEVKE